MPKFLIIRFSSIGDIVLTTAAIRCLKLQVPDAKVHFLCKNSMRSVTQSNPYIDKFHYLNDDLGLLIRELKKENFDTVIDLHKNFRSYRIRFALGRPVLSYRKLSVEKFLLTRFHVDRMPRRHIAERCLDAVQPLGVKDDGLGLDQFVDAGTSLIDNPLPRFTQSGYVAMVIGASYETKKLPLEKLRELCNLIDNPVVLVGGQEDQRIGEELAAGFPEKVWNACGAYTLQQSAVVVRDARLVISHDTGLQYMACAFQKPVLAIWGGTTPALQVEPWYGYGHADKHRNFQVEGLECQPCSNYGSAKCPRGHFRCMRNQDIQQIAKIANTWFNSGPWE